MARKSRDTTKRRAGGALLLLVVLAVLAGCRTNPVTGVRELVLVPPEQELRLGDANHPNIVLAYEGEYQDRELKKYLGTVVQRLHRCSHRPAMPVDFTVLNTSVVNAFAIPGHVYATRGFLAQLQNEAQFAAVMGHELAHVTAGHTAKRMTNQLLTGLGFGAASGLLGESSGATAALTVARAGTTLLGLGYSREQERQADRVGTYYMALAGWDPGQAIEMQKLLDSLNEREDTILDRYLSTHPQTENRIGEIQSVIQQEDLRKYVQGNGVYSERWDRRLAGLKKVDSAFEPYDKGEEQLAKQNYRQALDAANEAIQRRSDQAQFYRLKGDALLGLGRVKEGREAYTKSLELYPRYVHANTGLGTVALKQEQYAEAEKQFAIAASDFPAGYAGHRGLGMARYHLAKYQEATGPLETASSAGVKDPVLHYVLGACYQKTSRLAEAYRQYRAAIDQGLSGERAAEARSRLQNLQSAVGAQPQ